MIVGPTNVKIIAVVVEEKLKTHNDNDRMELVLQELKKLNGGV